MSNEIKPTTSKRPSAIEHDDSGWIDALLNNDAAASPSIADDGFTAALMSSLPAPAHRWRYRWIVPMMAIAGFIVGMGLLSGGEDLSMVLTGLARMRSISLQEVLFAVLPLSVLYWLAFGAAWQET